MLLTPPLYCVTLTKRLLLSAVSSLLTQGSPTAYLPDVGVHTCDPSSQKMETRKLAV
jgi:hypothetical protein